MSQRSRFVAQSADTSDKRNGKPPVQGNKTNALIISPRAEEDNGLANTSEAGAPSREHFRGSFTTIEDRHEEESFPVGPSRLDPEAKVIIFGPATTMKDALELVKKHWDMVSNIIRRRNGGRRGWLAVMVGELARSESRSDTSNDVTTFGWAKTTEEALELVKKHWNSISESILKRNGGRRQPSALMVREQTLSEAREIFNKYYLEEGGTLASHMKRLRDAADYEILAAAEPVAEPAARRAFLPPNTSSAIKMSDNQESGLDPSPLGEIWRFKEVEINKAIDTITKYEGRNGAYIKSAHGSGKSASLLVHVLDRINEIDHANIRVIYVVAETIESEFIMDYIKKEQADDDMLIVCTHQKFIRDYLKSPLAFDKSIIMSDVPLRPSSSAVVFSSILLELLDKDTRTGYIFLAAHSSEVAIRTFQKACSDNFPVIEVPDTNPVVPVTSLGDGGQPESVAADLIS
ncbi:hypothetical protein KJ359_010117 [Pestalotiopsis sp. 9143b]|nr:hypothetical protein KJ359_010117 [Pestalotiopsis sp. 9143b]